MAQQYLHPDQVAASVAENELHEKRWLEFFQRLPIFDFTRSPRLSGNSLRAFSIVVLDSVHWENAGQTTVSEGICHVLRHSIEVYGKHAPADVYSTNWFWYLVKQSMKNHPRPTVQDIDYTVIKNVVYYYVSAFKKGISKWDHLPMYMAGGGALYTMLAEWISRTEHRAYTLTFHQTGAVVRLVSGGPLGQENARKRPRLEGPGAKENVGELEAAKQEIAQLQAHHEELVAQQEQANQELANLRAQLFNDGQAVGGAQEAGGAQETGDAQK